MGSGLSKAQRDCYQKYGGPGSEQHAVVVQKYTRRRLAQLRVARIRFKLEKEKVMQKLNMWKTKRQTENAAAAKLQAILRGHRVRKRAKKKMDKLRIEKEKRDKLAEEKRLREEEERRNREEERLAELKRKEEERLRLEQEEARRIEARKRRKSWGLFEPEEIEDIYKDAADQRAAKNLDAAVDLYEQLSSCARKTKNIQLEMDAYFEIGCTHEAINRDYQEAIVHYNKSMMKAVHLKHDEGELRSLMHIGHCYVSMNEREEAIKNYKLALRITSNRTKEPPPTKRTNDGASVPEEASLLCTCAFLDASAACWCQCSDVSFGCRKRAEGCFHGTLPNDGRNGRSKRLMRNESVINGKLGRLHDLQGSIPDALLCYEKELEIATELGDHEREIKSATNIGIIRAGYLEYDTALEHFDLALDRALQHSTWHAYQARAHGNVGNMLAKRLKFQKALENHKKDLRITLQHIPEDKIGTSVAYSNVGSCLCVLGRHEESLEFHFKDLKLLEEFLEEGEGTEKRIVIYNNIADVYREMGTHEKALEFHEKSLALAIQCGSRRHEALAYEHFANTYLRIGGKSEDALDYAHMFSEIVTTIDDKEGEGRAFGLVASVYQARGKYSRATEHFNKAIESCHETNQFGAARENLNKLDAMTKDIEDIGEGDSERDDKIATTSPAISQESILLFAAENGFIQYIQQVLNRGVDPNINITNRETKTIHVAAENGHLDIVQLLVASGADPNAETYLFEKAIDLANVNGHQHVVDFFVDECGNANSYQYSRRTVQERQRKRLVMRWGSDVSRPARESVISANRTIDEFDIDQRKDIYRRTPFMFACISQHYDWINQILTNQLDEDNAMLEQRDNFERWTLLFYLAFCRDEHVACRIAELILKHKPELQKLKDRFGKMAYEYAESQNKLHLKKILAQNTSRQIIQTALRKIEFACRAFFIGFITPTMLLASFMKRRTLSRPSIVLFEDNIETSMLSSVWRKVPGRSCCDIWFNVAAIIIILAIAIVLFVAYFATNVVGLAIDALYLSIAKHVLVFAFCVLLPFLLAKQAAKDPSLMTTKHPRGCLKLTLLNVLSLGENVIKFIISVGVVCTENVGSRSSVSNIIPPNFWSMLPSALLSKVDFVHVFFAAVFAVFCWCSVFSWMAANTFALERKLWREKFVFVNADFLQDSIAARCTVSICTDVGFLLLLQQLMGVFECDGSKSTMAASATVECWGILHQIMACTALFVLYLFLPTTLLMGSLMREKQTHDSQLEFLPAYKLLRRSSDIAIGSVCVLFASDSIFRLIVVLVVCCTAAECSHKWQACRHIWSVNHWMRASHFMVGTLSVYTFVNSSGWIDLVTDAQARQLVRYSWAAIWGLIIIFFLVKHCQHDVDRRRRIIPSKLRYAVTSHGTRNAYVRTYERRKGEREGGDIHDKTWEPKAAIEIKFKDDNDFDFSRELGK
jgi:tetratricopeptide (TPR) repeat protein